MKRWWYAILVGLIFGIFDWFYLDWLSRGFGPNLGDNPFIVIPIIIAMNYGIWLVPIIPIVIYEAKRSESIKYPMVSGILAWCSAIFSYYAFYATLLSTGQLIHLEHLNIFGEKYADFWKEYWQMFMRIILIQFLEWIPVAVIGGGVLGALAWWLIHRTSKSKKIS